MAAKRGEMGRKGGKGSLATRETHEQKPAGEERRPPQAPVFNGAQAVSAARHGIGGRPARPADPR